MLLIDQLPTRGKLTAIIGILLVAGFLTVNIANYRISSQSVRETLVNNELPLTSNNIYSEIQASLLRPIYISSLMANDTFLKDWMVEGEKDTGKVTRYLDAIRRHYHVSSTFVVSAQTQRYYYYDGILKTISPDVPKDSWFFTMQTHPESYRVDLDYNEANQNQLTVFVNHKLLDYKGRFIGVVGLGLDVISVAEMIRDYHDQYDRDIYFVDRDGIIKGHQDEQLIGQAGILSLPGIAEVADELLAGNSGSLSYQRGHDTILLSYRFIPELNWFLLVEQSEGDAFTQIRHALYLNLVIGALITLIVLFLSSYTLRLFHGRLEQMARIDKLTGLVNRQYFDAIYSHIIRRKERDASPLSLVIFDVDNLKEINDRHGHLEGDRTLIEVARITREQLRGSDVVCRWGGDEFTVLLAGCDEAAAQVLIEQIRHRVEQEVLVEGVRMSISAGIAQYRQGDDADSLLSRADKQLYEIKRGGKA